MKSKFIIFALTALFLVSMASAASLSIPSASIVVPTSVNQTEGQVVITFDLVNSGAAADIDWSESIITQTSAGATFSFSKNSIADGSVTPVTESVTATISFDESYEGTLSGTIVANPSGLGDSKSFAFTLNVLESESPFVCEFGNPNGNIKVDVKDIQNSGEFGKDDEWHLFDPITVEFRVQNKGDEKIEDIVVEWGVYSEETNEWVIDVDDENDFNLKDGDDESVTVSFTITEDDLDVDLEDLEAGDLTIFVRASGDDAETDATICSSDSETVELIIDDDFVIVSNVQMAETAQCGDTVTVTADAWNIGDNDEDDVSVLLRSDELFTAKEITVGDISSLDNERISFSFAVSKSATEKVYGIRFYALDEDGDVFQNDDDEESLIELPLTVSGGCILPTNVDVSAVLDSDAVAGQDLIVKATLTNTGNSAAEYDISVTNYASWAELKSISDESVSLEKGASKDVTITLVPSKDAEGDKEFTLQVSFDDKVKEQKIGVSIEKPTGFAGITGSVIGGGNTVVTALIVAIIILVVLIIIVAVSLSRKSNESE